jgi:hypothetical protein
MRGVASSNSSTATSGQLVVGWNYSFDADGRKVAERKLHALDQSESYAMDSLGRLTQFQRGSLLGVNVTTPSPIGLQARNWSLDHANNWANYTSTQGGATSFASRNHTVTNELVQQVAASNTSYVYDANGNLVTDGVNSYKWDFKNRLREVWTTTNGTPDEIVAKYWYDAENRRVRKQTFQDQSMVDYYVDGMREIQETATCTGIPLRQYVRVSWRVADGSMELGLAKAPAPSAHAINGQGADYGPIVRLVDV